MATKPKIPDYSKFRREGFNAPGWAMNKSGTIDLSELAGFFSRLQQLKQIYGPAFMKVQPRFGAYMEYSAVLEYGWKDGRSAAFHVRGDILVVSSVGIPHIRPAVLSNIGTIVTHLRDTGVKACREVLYAKGVGTPLTTAQMVKRVEMAWGQVLNDKPRRDAVNNAPYEFGFHRRSIQGSAYPLDPAKIETMRSEAERKRKALRDRQQQEFDD